MKNYIDKIALDNVDFETLPVLKITNYTNSDNPYKPFTQIKWFIDENENLTGQVISFEENPISEGKNEDVSIKKDECIVISFSFDNKHIFNVYANSLGNKYEEYLELGDNQKTENIQPVENVSSITKFKGGDQQGFYWGIKFCINKETVKEILKEKFEEEKNAIYLNVTKNYYINNELSFGFLHKDSNEKTGNLILEKTQII